MSHVLSHLFVFAALILSHLFVFLHLFYLFRTCFRSVTLVQVLEHSLPFAGGMPSSSSVSLHWLSDSISVVGAALDVGRNVR